MKSLFVLLPCYNEQEDLELLIQKWQSLKPPLRQSEYKLCIVCIDDGSSDNTKEIILSAAQNDSSVTPLMHEKNRGLGEALKTGLKYFNEHASAEDIALVMDADNTHDPKYTFAMLDKIKNFDCVIASRYEAGASVQGLPSHRQFLSDGARVYYSLVLKVPNVKDYTCGYRIYSHAIIQKAFGVFGEDIITQSGFTCMMELLYKLSTIGAQFAEIPFELRYDYKIGKSKMKLLKTIIDSLFIALLLRINHNAFVPKKGTFQ